MRICFITKEMYPFFYGGIGVQLWLLMQETSRLGHEVHFVTRQPRVLPESWRESFYVSIEVHFSAKEEELLLPHSSLAYSGRVDTLIRELHKKHPFDLLVSADFDGEAFFVSLNPLVRTDDVKVPLLMTMHGLSKEVLQHNGRTPSAFEELVCCMEDTAVRNADYYTSPTRINWEEAAARLQIELGSAAILPNSVDRELFSSRSRARSLPSHRRIFFVGRLERRKGVDCLVRAFSKLVHSEPGEFELHLVGRDVGGAPAWEGTFADFCRTNLPPEVQRRIVFHGAVPPEKVSNLLDQAWVAVFPSRWEPFGIVALEAMIKGVPLLVSAGTGLEEVVGENYPWKLSRDSIEDSLVGLLLGPAQDKTIYAQRSRQVLARAVTLLEEGKTAWEGVLRHCAELRPAPRARDLDVRSLMKMLHALAGEDFTKLVRTSERQGGDPTSVSVLSELLELSQLKKRNSELLDEVRQLTAAVLQRDGEILRRDDLVRQRDDRISKLSQKAQR